MVNDYGLSDIVAERYDAGIRLGEQVDNAPDTTDAREPRDALLRTAVVVPIGQPGTAVPSRSGRSGISH